MLGAIIGDIVGSRFEFNNIKTKDFELMNHSCFFTDDTVMSLAIAKAILTCEGDYDKLGEQAIKYMQRIGQKYRNCGYGNKFYYWVFSNNPQPYGSYGNGAAMRVSACGLVAKSIEEAIELSRKVTEVTHNHPEGIKGAEATAVAIYLAKTGSNILEIRDYINAHYYPMNFKLDDIRDSYKFNETCQETVPQAIEAFLESNSFEDAIRNAISIGGDSDTLAAITGSIAEAYYGIPADIRNHAITFLDERLLKILVDFENKFPSNIEKAVKSGTKKEKIVKKVTKTDTRESMVEDSVGASEIKEENPEETTSQKLFNHLFEACNILRGPINQDEYKSYVTPILFFKRISDVYDEETEDAVDAYGEEASEFDEQHSFIIPDGCHWNDVRNASIDVGKAIVDAMSGIERANPDNLSGVFSSFDDAVWTDKTKLSDERLKDLIEHFSKIKVGNKNYSADVMGDAYEYLIKKFADMSKKNAGEFYTPRPIVKLLVDMLDPKAGEEIYDPACGTGGMLIEAIHHINNDKMTYGKIYGQENNLSTSAIARMNLFLHGAKDFKILKGDTLGDPKFIKGGKVQRFDCVLANPPFSLKDWGSAKFETDAFGRNIWGSPSDSSADFAWIQHMIASTKEKTGRCAFIISQGIQFHTGKEAEMRKQLVESDLVECIIDLAGGVFYSTGVKACIVFLSKCKKPEHKNKILMIDGSKIFTEKRAQNVMEPKDIKQLFDLFTNYDDVIEKSKVVSLDDIRAKNYNLELKNYIEKAKKQKTSFEDASKQYKAVASEALESEKKTISLLKNGGYIHE